MGETTTETRTERRLREVKTEIAQIENRLAVAHALGDNNSAQGISQSFSANEYWTKRLDTLRALRDKLEDKAAGIRSRDASVVLGVIRGY